MTAKESIRMGQSTGKLSRESSSIEENSSNVRSRREADSVERVYPDEEFPLPDTPDDILFEILQWVPTEDIVKSCVYVCKQWKGVIDTQMFWKEKCIKDLGYTNEMFHFLTDEDCKLLYFKRPYQNNLIKNPDAKEGFKYWTIHANGGDQWKAESPVGCDPVENFTNNQLLSGETRCWVTSFGVCSKSQTIDLVDRGCSSHILDEVRPHIHLTEWYAARVDCGIIYKLNVQLLKSLNDEKPIKEWSFEDTRPAGREWFKADHVMSDYEPGVRFIRFYHEGKDTQFWAGWYGAKMTLSTVIIDLKKVKQ